jgi:hypothetical protein
VATLLKMDLWDEFKMLVKLVDNPEEMNEQEEDPDVFTFQDREPLEVSNWLYEFVTLSIRCSVCAAKEEMGGPNATTRCCRNLRKWKPKQWKTMPILYGKDWISLRIINTRV